VAGRVGDSATVDDGVAEVVPLAQTMKEQINHIRSWAFERAVRASPVAVGG
jgi:poly(A) polymerase Pap1